MLCYFFSQLNKWGGNYLNYAVNTALVGGSLLYLIFWVKDIERPKEEKESKGSFFAKYLKQPWMDFINTMKKPRQGNRKVFLYLLLIVHAIFWGAGAYAGQIYLYMLKVIREVLFFEWF